MISSESPTTSTVDTTKPETDSRHRLASFWSWLFLGSGGEPGWHRVIGPLLLFDMLIALICVAAVDVSPSKASTAVILPLSGALIGLAVAWAGNVQSLILSPQIRGLSSNSPGKLGDYLFPFQLGVLIILVALAAWALAALGVFDFAAASDSGAIETPRIGTPSLVRRFQDTVLILLLLLSSMTVRVCWQIIRHIFMLIEATVVIDAALAATTRDDGDVKPSDRR